MALNWIGTVCVLLMFLAGCVKTTVPMPHGTSNRIHIVKPGETLYSIGRREGLDYRLLARRNHIRPPYRIYVGQRIYLDRIAPPHSRLPRVDGTKKQESANTPRVQGKGREKSGHRVGRKSALRLQWPVRGTLISTFGRSENRINDGIDISAPRGTPVHAAERGVVVYSGRSLQSYGNLIILRHEGNLFTAYAHNEVNLVRKGDNVKAGDVIARVGATGNVTTPRLHFEVRRGTIPVDPLFYLPRR